MTGIQDGNSFGAIIDPKERESRKDEWELEKVNVQPAY
jgi:hypothetical protein